MKATLSEISKNIQILAATPGRLATATAGVNLFWLDLKPDPGSWSALDILAHLRACTDVWSSSIESILIDKDPALPDIHPRQYLTQTDYPSLDFTDSRMAFSRQRE